MPERKPLWRSLGLTKNAYADDFSRQHRLLACNPSIGGTAKGHLVREIDALGGEMGIAADKTAIQIRMLNRSKGPAVQSLRAQVDKFAYHDYMKSTLENTDNLDVHQAEVKEIIVEGGCVKGVRTMQQTYYADAVLLCCGVYLKSVCITGTVSEQKGPASFMRSEYLSDSLKKPDTSCEDLRRVRRQG